MKKIISIVTPTYNEEENIERMVKEIEKVMDSMKDKYEYEHVVIDNNSKDKTVEILKKIASDKKNLKVIVNTRNFGQSRSPFHALLQTKGDAVITMAADFQDPVELIKDYIGSWEKGSRVTLAKNINTQDSLIISKLKKLYYELIHSISEVKVPMHTTGSGIYDRKIIDVFKKINDPYPYHRGLIAEIEDEINFIEFDRPVREKGESKNSFLSLYNVGMMAIAKHSSVPLRIVIFLGLLSSLLSFISGVIYLIYKLLYWDSFSVGIGPLVIGMFFFFLITILIIGIIGEYILLILTYSKNLPLVIEKERINFD